MDHLQNVLSYFDQQQPLCAEHDRIPKDLYREFGVKAGLRDETGKGFIALNFFNVFWIFVVCSVLGLIIEVVYHFVIVVPGEYQDRAGMLFGPFSQERYALPAFAQNWFPLPLFVPEVDND